MLYLELSWDNVWLFSGGSETHVSTSKAASVIGVQYKSTACSPRDGVALRGSQVAALIQECLSEGLLPFYLTVTLGTTNSCAIDDFGGIADVTRMHPDIWVHVDAAFAGAALACDEYQSISEPFEHFDSFSVNMGKWLLTNLDST